MTVKAAPDGGAELPYHDDYLKLDLPGLLDGKLRLNVELRFGRFTNSGYYGMGNSSPALDGEGSRFHQYDRIFPRRRTHARLQVIPHLSLLLGGSFTYNWITLYAPSSLAEDLLALRARHLPAARFTGIVQGSAQGLCRDLHRTFRNPRHFGSNRLVRQLLSKDSTDNRRDR